MGPVGAGRENLRPYLSELVSVLIEAQSAIEPAALQYMQFHAGREPSQASSGGGGGVGSMSEEALERLRYGLSQSGPLQEALDHCLLDLDASSIQGKVPSININPRQPYNTPDFINERNLPM